MNDPFIENPQLKKHNFLSSLNFYIRSSLKEAKRRRLYFFLAICSTLIVVCSTAISQTIIDYAPLIFLKTCEAKAGSIDVSINPSYLTVTTNDGITARQENKRLLFNTTRIRDKIDKLYPGTATPRYSVSALLMAPSHNKDCTPASVPPYQSCFKISGKFVLQNTKREADIGMGNKLPLPDEIQEGSVIMSKKQAQALRLNVGDSLIAQLDVREVLLEAIINFNFQQSNVEDRIDTLSIMTTTIYLPIKIENIVESLSGKFPDEEFGETLVYEYKYFFKAMAKHLPEGISLPAKVEKLRRFIENQSPEDYADQVLFNLKDRQKTYLDTNFDNIQSSITKFASQISQELGIFPFDMELPVFESLYPMRFGSLFLGVSLKLIIVILFLLSIIVIYNLLQVTVETKTFEFGVIRMLGLNKIGVAELILIQALLFVAPGLVFGLLCSIPLLGKIGSFLEEKLNAQIPYYPTPDAMFWAIVIGLLIPIISSYYPMKEALGKNLNLSLDLLRSKTNAIQISIEQEIKKFPWTRITFAILAVAFGLSLYLFLPLSLLTFDLGLLLSMFFMTIMGIFLGLALLSLNFQYIVEKFVTQVFFFWTGTSFRTLILKNLIAHKVRNRQTSLMYSLSLGFIIFITVSLNQEISNIAFQIQAFRGSMITATDTWNIDRQILEDHIHDKMGDVVESYAWITDDLVGFLNSRGYKGVSVSNRGRLYNIPGRIFGVSPSIFKATLRQFLSVDKIDEESALDLGEQLYTARGSQSVILGEYYRDYMDLTLDPDSTIMLSMVKGVETRHEEVRVLASMNYAPGFRFSQIPLVKNQDIIVSLPTFMRLAGDEVKRFEDLPLRKVFLNVKDNSEHNLERAYSSLVELRNDKYPGLRIWDFRDVQNSLDKSEFAISIIFVSVESIVMVLSLFSLITSMSTNILEQSKEIAILRAMGVTKKMINRLFVAEGFVLVFSSSLFGILIGAVVGWTISLQRILFTQLPVAFGFPYKDLVTVFIAAVLSAMVSSYYPAKRISDMSIGKVIRQGE